MRKWIGTVVLGLVLLFPVAGYAQQGTMANSAPVVIASDQSAVPVSGTVTATGPLTDTQLRATPVPVSGTVTANQGTAGAVTNGWPITYGTIAATTGTITAGGVDCSVGARCVSMGGLSTMSSVIIQFTTANISNVIKFEQSIDAGTTWFPLPVMRMDALVDDSASNAAGQYISMTGCICNQLAIGSLVGAVTDVRVRASTYVAGTLNITIAPSAEPFQNSVANGNLFSVNGQPITTSIGGNGVIDVGLKTTGLLAPAATINSFFPSTYTVGEILTFDDVAPTSCSEGNHCVPRISANRNQYFTLRDAAGNERGANVNASNELLTALSALPAFSAIPTFKIDQTTPGTTNRVDIGVFPDNEPINVAQINGVAVTMGNGASGTGVQRVTLANDSTGKLAAVDTITNVVHVDDNAGSLTIDNANLDAAISTRLKPADTLTAVTTVGTITNVVHVDDNAGSLTVDGTVTANPSTTNHLSLAVSESIAAPTATTWYLKRLWPLPASAHFIPSRAYASVTTAGSRTLIGVVNNLGNLNVGTNTFTDGNSVASPRHYARLIGCVTTVLSATLDTITVTYADELNNSQTTAAVSFAASTPVGNCFDFPLVATTGQMLDGGIRDITASADTAATTGVVTFYGLNPILDTLGVANAYEQSDYDQGELSSAEQIAIIFMQAATTAQQRNAGVLGSIR